VQANLRMQGKSAIVTGAAGGIGASICELFCREGGSILLFDQSEIMVGETAARLRKQFPNARVETSIGDVSDPRSAEKAVAQADAIHGSLDVLINNAAVRNHSSVADSDLDEWKRLMAVNVFGAVAFCKAALPSLRKSGNGSIVNVSSCYAVVGRSGMPIYDATKAALLSLTRTVAFEEAQHGVRVNAVCPGGTLTPFTMGRGAARGERPEDMAKEVRKDSLLRRWARPEEVAYPVLWLASDESSYMTGATVMVDGGLSIM
jgi:2-hydroxycyclohexanecarboxyl-CoA dehydrogenase